VDGLLGKAGPDRHDSRPAIPQSLKAMLSGWKLRTNV
jgi:hypothetical protein